MLGAFADRAIRHKQNRNSQWKEIKSQNKNQELSRISGNRWRSKKLRFILLTSSGLNISIR